tara:strand:- start:247 stop:1248 length:1002 start_codon:yes stop_codon:yes gene_type:complete
MKNIIFSVFITSIVYMNDDLSVLVLTPYSAIHEESLDQNDISTINMLFIQGLNKYIKNIQSSSISCMDNQCALDELYKTNNDQVAYTRLQKLGTKIIFSASILDQSNVFESKATAMNVEDMERVALRVSKSIALRESLEEVADIDNVIEEEQEEPARRKSLGRFGISMGVLHPLGNSFSHIYSNQNDNNNNNIKFGMHWYSEFKNNTAFLGELEMYHYTMGFNANLLKFTNKKDTSPFYGGGASMYSYNGNTSINNESSSTAIGINIQGGVLLYRTYNFNIFARAKYIQMFNENRDNCITLDIGIQKKFESNQKKKTTIINRYPILEAIFGRN